MLKFRWETEFKETEIGEIPKDWEVKKLEVYNLKYGKGLPKNQRKKGNVPVVGSSGIVGYHEKAIASGPGIVIGRKGNVGSVYFLKENFFPIDTVFYIESLSSIEEAKYLYYVLSQYDFDQLMSDSAVPGLNINLLRDVVIPFLNPEEQTRIATVLSWLDDLIENKRRQNEILEKTAMAIFKSWFIDFEPFQDEEFVYNEELDMEIPKGWDVRTLGCLVDEIMSGRGKYYMIREIQKGESKVNSLEGLYPLWGANGILGYVSGWNLDGWIILTGRVGTLGKVFITTGRVALSDNVFGILSKQFENIFYVYLWLKLMVDFESLNVGSTQPLITKKDLENLRVLLPPQPILQRFHSLVEPLFQKIILNQKQILTLKKIRDTLLPQLVFGRLRVEDI